MRIPLAKPFIHEDDITTGVIWHRQILESGILINGPYTQQFETETAQSAGVAQGIAVSASTTALQIILEYIGVKGKKVLIPANIHIANFNAVLFAGGTPSLADMGEDLLVDADALMRLADTETKAVIVSHIGGTIHSRIKEIAAFCKERGIYLIEDAAHAHGASLNGEAAGSFGFAAVFSYHASKVMTTGAGGMIVTNHEPLAEHARIARYHGEAKQGIQTRRGADWLMTEFQAAAGLLQLRRLDEIIERRAEIAATYTEALNDLPLRFFPLQTGAVSGYDKYFVRFDSSAERERVQFALERAGIQTGMSYWPPIHLQPVNIGTCGYSEGDFPVAETVLKEVMALPMFTGMFDEEVDQVISALRAAMRREMVVTPHLVVRRALPYSA